MALSPWARCCGRHGQATIFLQEGVIPDCGATAATWAMGTMLTIVPVDTAVVLALALMSASAAPTHHVTRRLPLLHSHRYLHFRHVALPMRADIRESRWLVHISDIARRPRR